MDRPSAHSSDEPVAARFWLGVGAIAAALAGFGAILWVAANWNALGRFGQFALLQTWIAAACGLAIWRLPTTAAPVARASARDGGDTADPGLRLRLHPGYEDDSAARDGGEPADPGLRLRLHPGSEVRGAALLAFVGIGALFAYFGQTYQTGADPWQLFALWALLGLPLCLAARGDLLWLPWGVVASTAVALWLHAWAGRNWSWSPESGTLALQLAAWLLQGLIVAALGPWAASRTGAGAWSFRLAAANFVGFVTLLALTGLFARGVGALYPAGLVVLAVCVVGVMGPLRFDVFALSVAVLGLDALLVAGLIRALAEMGGGDWLGRLLLISLASAGLLALSVQFILARWRLWREFSTLPEDTPGEAEGQEGDTLPMNLVVDDAQAQARSVHVRGADVPDESALPTATASTKPQGPESPAARPPATTPAAPSPQSTSPSPRDARAAPRPWPVVLLTATGAWIASIPLMIAIGTVLSPLVVHGVGALPVGLLMLAAAWVILRSRDLPVFVEQLALPVLLAGAGTLAMGLGGLLPDRLALAVLACVAVGFAAGVPQAWLRSLLGAAAAACLLGAVRPELSGRFDWRGPAFWLCIHVVLGLWLALQSWGLRRRSPGSSAGELADSLAPGWLATCLVALALHSGQTFLLGAGLGHGIAQDLMAFMLGRDGMGWADAAMRAASAAMALGAAALAARHWPALAEVRTALVALLAATLAFALPDLGGALLAGTLCLIARQRLMAGAAAATAAWIIGSFYYLLHWPLALKALLMLGAGAVLGLLAWMRQRERRAPRVAPRTAGARPVFTRERLLVGLGALAVLMPVNLSIRQKEDLIAHGRAIFVELAPVDPRSLMQGDYMHLNFRVPAGGRANRKLLYGRRPHAVGQVDDRGVARFSRIEREGESLAANEIRVQLTSSAGQWTLVTDAWHFAEGDGARWQAARFGEFRVRPDGQALLVGMADQDLRRIEAPTR